MLCRVGDQVRVVEADRGTVCSRDPSGRGVLWHAERAVVVGTGRHPATLRAWLRLLPVSVIECPGCGEDEDLSGNRRGGPGNETITVTCGACELVWERDLTPRCPTCGSEDVRAALRSIVDKSRGTQLSIQSMQVVHLCRECDAEQLAVWNRSNTPLAPDELPFDPH